MIKKFQIKKGSKSDFPSWVGESFIFCVKLISCSSHLHNLTSIELYKTNLLVNHAQ